MLAQDLAEFLRNKFIELLEEQIYLLCVRS